MSEQGLPLGQGVMDRDVFTGEAARTMLVVRQGTTVNNETMAILQ